MFFHRGSSHRGEWFPTATNDLPLGEWLAIVGMTGFTQCEIESQCRPHYLTLYTFPDQKNSHPIAKGSALEKMEALHNLHQYSSAHEPSGEFRIYQDDCGSIM